MSGVFDAAALLRDGGLLVYPTETVYGIGTALSAGNPGLARIREAKGSAPGRPFLLLAGSVEQAFGLWAEVPPAGKELAESAWPGPLTLVGPAREGLPSDLLGSARDGRLTVSVRVPGDDWLLSLVREVGEPVVSTSANRAGDPPPVSFGDIPLGWLAPDLAINRGRCPGGVPSTLVTVAESVPRVLRPGAWTGELPGN